MQETGVWYFTYGSNLDPERFRNRVGTWSERRAATLDGWRLFFSERVTSEGGGGAVAVVEEGARLYGAVLFISQGQMEDMDRIELAADRNREGAGVRRRIEVRTEEGPVEAEMYTVPEEGRFAPPSSVYLDHILRGLAAVGHPTEVLQEARRRAAGA